MRTIFWRGKGKEEMLGIAFKQIIILAPHLQHVQSEVTLYSLLQTMKSQQVNLLLITVLHSHY